MDAAGVGGNLPTQLVADYLALGDDDAPGRRWHGARHTVYALLLRSGEFAPNRSRA